MDSRFEVDHYSAFPAGFFCVGVEASTDFEKLGKADPQARDANGERIWIAKGWDPNAAAPGKFGQSSEVKVKIVAPQMPVLPSSPVPGYPPLVVFVGLEATPWTDNTRCTPAKKGEQHKCRAKLAWSYWATGIADPAEVEGGYDAADRAA